MDPAKSFLLTDLYQLAMMEAYVANDETDTAVFEFFVRKLPARRNFFVAAGLEQVLDFLQDIRVSQEDLDWLDRSGQFGKPFLDHLSRFRFTGDVHAMPEGTVFFPDEPILRVTAPLPEAQYVESRIINLLQFQTIVASRAVRMTVAARGRQLVDFGLRRAHGSEAGILAARAAYLAGFTGTATVLAGQRFDMPIQGTMAHSFIQAHEDEAEAFLRFARARPENLVLLIDTYDTERGAERVARLAPRLKAEGITLRGVRLDSGDLDTLARRVRDILDAAGLEEVDIFASGGLDEDRIAALVDAGAPIDGFGVGSSLTTASDAPVLDCAYKLQEYAGLARRKLSTGKATWPGRKQVWRRHDADGLICGDVMSLEEDNQDGTPLIHKVMEGGRRLEPSPRLEAVREHTSAQIDRLPETLRGLAPDQAYTVEVGAPLEDLAREVDRRMEVPERKETTS